MFKIAKKSEVRLILQFHLARRLFEYKRKDVRENASFAEDKLRHIPVKCFVELVQ